ncbi:MAG: hypothetical protein K0S16_1586 [Moraxellaceae bacterium]|nr:hypothetical protein [Moraxellaceae bacterium]
MRALTSCLMASALALLLAAPAEARCTDLASRKAPRLYDPERVRGADGPFTYRRADYAYCRDDGWVYRRGITDANGAVLVPVEFTDAVLIGPRHALVREPVKKHSRDPGPWQFYEVGTGLTGPAPAFDYVGPVSHSSINYSRSPQAMWIPYGYVATARDDKGRPTRYDYYLFPDGLPTPRRYPDLGAPGLSPFNAILHHGSVLYTTFTGPDGEIHSRLLNLRGDPISPVLSRVETWRTSRFEGTLSDIGSNQTALGDELFVVVPLLPHPELPAKLYVPLREDGSARPLPPGVVGVFPLMAVIEPDGRSRTFEQDGRVTYGWAVVLDTPQGLRFVVGNGLIADVLDLVGKQTPVAGVKHFTRLVTGAYTDFLLLKSAEDGLWRAVTLRFQPPYVADPDKGYASAQLAFDATADGQRQRWAEDRARQEREYAEAAKREFEFREREYQALLAKGGDFCKNDPKVIQLMHAPAINRMLSECGVTDFMFLQSAQNRGADPALIQRALAKREAIRRDAEFRQMESDRRSRALAEAEFQARVDAATRASDLMRGMNSAHDSFMKSSRDTYYRNLDAWNRGAQNWGGPRD